MDKYITIPLSKTGKKYAGLYETIVSPEDADLAEFNWFVSLSRQKTCYVVMLTNIRMHRVIMERMLEGRKLLTSEFVDHINRNPLDNRRENLRIVTNAENLKNKGVYKKSKTRVKGVRWDEERRKFRAQIQVDKKKIMIGQYDTLEEAKEAYRQASIKYHGKFASSG